MLYIDNDTSDPSISK